MIANSPFEIALNESHFKIIGEVADAMQVPCYVIGGFVRDLILERDSKKDIDIVCVGSGIALAKAVQKKLPNAQKVQVFKSYGTAMVQAGDLVLEFVGARKESYSSESRNPEVEPGMLEQPPSPPHFTFTALSLRLHQ